MPVNSGRQVKLKNRNQTLLFATICYNYYLYYLRLFIKCITSRCNVYKSVIAISVVTSMFAFIISIGVLLQAIFTHFNSNFHLQDDMDRRLHEERLLIKLAPGNVSKWIPEENGILFTSYFDPRMDVVQLISYGPQRKKKPEYNVFGLIRIFAIFPRNWHATELYCHIRYPDGKQRVIPSTETHAMQWDDAYEFSGFSVLCDVEYYRYAEHLLPQYVGLSERPSSELIAGVYLPIIYPKRILGHRYPEFQDQDHQLAICIGPKNNLFETTSMHLMEFFDYYRKWGANQVYIYGKEWLEDSSIGAVLRDWMKKDFVTMIPWDLQGYTNYDLYEGGNVVAWNDCLYRAGFYYGFRFITVLDVNEFIWMRSGVRFGALIKQLHKQFHDHPIFTFEFEDYYTQYNDHSKWTETDYYCLANEVLPFEYTPNRYLFRGYDTLSVTEKQIESTEASAGDPQVDVPERIAIIKRFKLCHIRMEHCQCNFEWPSKEKQRLKDQKRYKKSSEPAPKEHHKYKPKKYDDYKKSLKLDDDDISY